MGDYSSHIEWLSPIEIERIRNIYPELSTRLKIQRVFEKQDYERRQVESAEGVQFRFIKDNLSNIFKSGHTLYAILNYSRKAEGNGMIKQSYSRAIFISADNGSTWSVTKINLDNCPRDQRFLKDRLQISSSQFWTTICSERTNLSEPKGNTFKPRTLDEKLLSLGIEGYFACFKEMDPDKLMNYIPDEVFQELQKLSPEFTLSEVREMLVYEMLMSLDTVRGQSTKISINLTDMRKVASQYGTDFFRVRYEILLITPSLTVNINDGDLIALNKSDGSGWNFIANDEELAPLILQRMVPTYVAKDITAEW